jgi:plasmid maintenance system antidote protein VapI
MVHEKVREHIRKMEVKQNWLARRMNLTDGALSLMLSGKRKMTADELERLCAILCVSADTFIKPDELKFGA